MSSVFRIKSEVTVHSLKITPYFFKHVKSGAKPFEIRFNDRGFKVGDILVLEEFDVDGTYTGDRVCKTVTFVTDWEQKKNYVVMGIV